MNTADILAETEAVEWVRIRFPSSNAKQAAFILHHLTPYPCDSYTLFDRLNDLEEIPMPAAPPAREYGRRQLAMLAGLWVASTAVIVGIGLAAWNHPTSAAWVVGSLTILGAAAFDRTRKARRP